MRWCGAAITGSESIFAFVGISFVSVFCYFIFCTILFAHLKDFVCRVCARLSLSSSFLSFKCTLTLRSSSACYFGIVRSDAIYNLLCECAKLSALHTRPNEINSICNRDKTKKRQLKVVVRFSSLLIRFSDSFAFKQHSCAVQLYTRDDTESKKGIF